MHIDEACKLLGIDATTPEMWRNELFQLLQTNLKAKIEQAPTPKLKTKYSGALAKLDEAAELINQAVTAGDLPSFATHTGDQGGQPKKQKFWDTLANPDQTIELIVRAAEGGDITILTEGAARKKVTDEWATLADAEDSIEVIDVAPEDGGELTETIEDAEDTDSDTDQETTEEESQVYDLEELQATEDEDKQDNNQEATEEEEADAEEEEEEQELVYTIEKRTKLNAIGEFFGKISQRISSVKLFTERVSNKATDAVASVVSTRPVRIFFGVVFILALPFLAYAGWWMYESPRREKATELVDYAEDFEKIKAWNKAADFYQQALDVKSNWQDAKDGLYRVKLEFIRQMKHELMMAEQEEDLMNFEKALRHLQKAQRLDVEEKYAEIQEAISRVEDLIASSLGTLIIQTIPEDATVSITDKKSKASPARYDGLKFGTYSVSIRKRGFKSTKQDVILNKGTVLLGPIHLERIKGALDINTKPQGAGYTITRITSEASSDSVFKPRNGVAPALEPGLPTGTYLIKINKLGWMDEELQVSVRGASQQEVTIRFNTLDDRPDIDDPEILSKLLGDAVDINSLQVREKDGEELVYDRSAGAPFTGRIKQLHDNGQTRAFYALKDGKKQGLLIWWHDNGERWSEMFFKDGLKHGLFTFWDDSGQMLSQTSYADGKKHGLCAVWDESGKKISETHYQEDEKHGLETLWRQEGPKLSETNYEKGKQHGLTTEYYKDGQKKKESNYDADVLHGITASWDRGGQQKSEISYKHGKRHGLSIEWHSNGTKSWQSSWQDGEPHGPSISWDEAGKKKSETLYKEGRVVR